MVRCSCHVCGPRLIGNFAGGYKGDAGALAVVWSFVVISLSLMMYSILRPKLVLADDKITVVKLFGAARVDWGDVAGVVSGYWGLTIILRDSRRVRAQFILAKPNYSLWLGRETRADKVAKWIVDLAGVDRQARGSQLRSRTFYFL
jgi:hypothetical protein